MDFFITGAIIKFVERNFELTSIVADNLGFGLFRFELIPQRRFTAANSTLGTLLVYNSRRDLFAQDFQNLFYNREDAKVFFEIVKRQGAVKSFEALLKKQDGSFFWAALTVSSVFSKKQTQCLEGIIQDVAYKKEMHSQLLLEKDFLQRLFDNMPDAVYFKDKNNRITKVNKFYTKGTGLKENEIIGKTDFDFFPFEQAREMFEDDSRVLTTGKPMVGKIERTLLPNGSW